MNKYPSIECLRHVIRTMRHNGVSRLGVYGTVKLHGTHGDIVQTVDENECVGYAKSGMAIIATTYTFQSRNRQLTENDDNANFMTTMRRTLGDEEMDALFDKVRARARMPSSSANGCLARCIMLSGEWCGEGVQKHVALSRVSRMFVIFDIQIDGRWCQMQDFADVHDNAHGVYNIMQFPIFEDIIIDTTSDDALEKVQSELIRLTEQVERQCPVGLHFGVNGPGEGIVWKPVEQKYNKSAYWFKVKGEKFAVTTPRTKKDIAALDVEQRDMQMSEFVITRVSINRCRQALSEIREGDASASPDANGGDTPKQLKVLASYYKWVYADVMKEEADFIHANGWNQCAGQIKSLAKLINAEARKHFTTLTSAAPA